MTTDNKALAERLLAHADGWPTAYGTGHATNAILREAAAALTASPQVDEAATLRAFVQDLECECDPAYGHRCRRCVVLYDAPQVDEGRGQVVTCRGPGLCEACSRAAGCCFKGERCGRTSCPTPKPNTFPKPTPCPNSTPQPQGIASGQVSGGGELLPLPKPPYIDEHNLHGGRLAYSIQQMKEYARANVERALAESRAEVEALRSSMAGDAANHVAIERDHHKARAERLAGLLKIVSAVGIVQLYDTHPDDVVATFSLDELGQISRITENKRTAQVESIYREGWDAALTDQETT